MSRELNQEIFGENPQRPTNSPSTPSYSIRSPERVQEEDQRLISHHMDTLKRRMKEYENKLEYLNSRMTEMMNATKARVERVAAAAHRVDEFAKQGFHELNQKYAMLSSKVSERKVQDTKVEQLVERHAQVINQFELRLHQLQKVVSEQEMQLHNSRSALQEALREIARLKKI